MLFLRTLRYVFSKLMK